MSRQNSTPPDPNIWELIKAKQAELNGLYEIAASGIYKSTEGESFLGEKNVSFAQYWLGSVKKAPKTVTGEFDLPDYDVKTGLFPLFVEAYNGHNAAGAVLETPYDILSKDILRYSWDAKKAFEGSNDPVRKQTVKDAPSYRKQPVSKSKDDKGGDNKTEKTA
jgi:hypothetical protein